MGVSTGTPPARLSAGRGLVVEPSVGVRLDRDVQFNQQVSESSLDHNEVPGKGLTTR